MIEISVGITILLLCLLSFFDLIIFNEEILLTLCFLSFLFYCFNSLSDSIASMFEARAAKFEDDLLTRFSGSKDLLFVSFTTNLKLQNFVDKISILLLSLTHFLTNCVNVFQYKST
jgi:hypothetical protein